MSRHIRNDERAGTDGNLVTACHHRDGRTRVGRMRLPVLLPLCAAPKDGVEVGSL